MFRNLLEPIAYFELNVTLTNQINHIQIPGTGLSAAQQQYFNDHTFNLRFYFWSEQLNIVIMWQQLKLQQDYR